MEWVKIIIVFRYSSISLIGSILISNFLPVSPIYSSLHSRQFSLYTPDKFSWGILSFVYTKIFVKEFEVKNDIVKFNFLKILVMCNEGVPRSEVIYKYNSLEHWIRDNLNFLLKIH